MVSKSDSGSSEFEDAVDSLPFSAQNNFLPMSFTPRRVSGDSNTPSVIGKENKNRQYSLFLHQNEANGNNCFMNAPSTSSEVIFLN